MRRIAISIVIASILVWFPTAAKIPLNVELIQRSVVFIYRADNREDPGKNRLLGTAFLVSVPRKSAPDRLRIFLITARHILDPAWAGCDEPNPLSLFVRVNTKDYTPTGANPGVAYVPLDLVVDNKPGWYAHTDDQVDVAIVALNAAAFKNYEVAWIPLREFGTQEEVRTGGVGIGDQVVSAGVVEGLSENRNYPAFKFGRISNIPTEPIEVICRDGAPRKLRKAWFIAASFIPGNSGSPVFLLPLDFVLGSGLEFKGPRAMLLGMLVAIRGGADIGHMVPVEYIFEVIEKNAADADLYRGPLKEHEAAKDSPPR